MTDTRARDLTAQPATFHLLFNFRDLGGKAGHRGRLVRYGRVFRSDSLHRLGETDRAAFTALGVRTVIDLRRPYEVERDGRVPDWDGLTWLHIHPEHREWDETPYDGDGDGDLARWLADRYLDLAETGAEALAAAVSLIADADAAPVVVHCVAGKDRTGVVSALTLSTLGVADGDIAADYAQSTDGMRRYLDWLTEHEPDHPAVGRPPLTSPAEAMLTFLAGVRGRYGSVEGYLRTAGVSAGRIDALRDHLLE